MMERILCGGGNEPQRGGLGRGRISLPVERHTTSMLYCEWQINIS